ncbi:MAG TPA: carboxypeptidase-like regulatory domain-containing protein [Cyclobacteriaceae bacterium]|jgi:hypothetical protein|nr:carboxypeptidase-like regulatory domain-containing protein [Cyclobacteriaceae bacterium]
MKTQILLDIKKPCSENWESFTSTSAGGFCSSCSKTVIDFTKMTDSEILNFFSNQKDKTCGRFRSDQLKHYSYAEPAYIKPGLNLLKAGLLSLFIFLASRPSVAQTPEGPKFKIVQPATQLVQPTTTQEKVAPIDVDHLIKGIVKSKDDGSSMAGVNIYVKGGTEGTVSDADGQFVFPRRLNEGEVLILSFLGFETVEYVVKKDATETIELSMGLSCIVLGEVAADQVYQPKQSSIKRALQKVKIIF